jgi:hypothetical protein
MRKITVIIIALILILVGGFFIFTENRMAPTETDNQEDKLIDIEPKISDQPEEKKEAKPSEIRELPKKISIEVPFTPQAPFAVWDEYHNEACEEASLVMLKYYLDGKKLTPEIAEQEIQALFAYQIKKFGDPLDTDMEETALIGREFYQIPNLKVIYDFPKAKLKEKLAEGKPVIVPTAGRLLGNPNFKTPGPLYHNLVLIGYNGDKIITNDPGTRKGQGYIYDIDTLYNAIHDFPGRPEDILEGRKAMIVLE